MFSRKLLWCVPVAGAVGAGVGIDRWLAAGAADGKQDLKPAVSLPMTRVVLFNRSLMSVSWKARSTRASPSTSPLREK